MTPPPPGRAAWRALLRAMASLLLIACAVFVVAAGLKFRAWTWQVTEPIRFKGDITNALGIGRMANHAAIRLDGGLPGDGQRATWPSFFRAYFDVYESVYRRAAAGGGEIADGKFRLDYPPGRLLVVSLWVRETTTPDNARAGYSDSLTAPLLRFNAAHELAAALGAFALVRRVLRDAGRSRLAAATSALTAGTLLWLNPALILDSHGWPQWEAWVLPYVIWAAYLGVIDRWMLAGVLLAVGAMLKGQVLMVAPLFILWPLFAGRWGATVRTIAGFLAAVALMMSPWLVAGIAETNQRFAWGWLAAMLLLAAMIACWPRSRRFGLGWGIIGSLFIIAAVVPVVGAGGTNRIPFVIAVALAFLLLPLGWRGARPAVFGLCGAAAVFFAAAWFGGSFVWLRVGFQTDRYPVMTAGPVANLPSLLATAYHLHTDTPITWFNGYSLPIVGALQEITLRQLLRAVASIGLALVAIAMARHHRRRDANLLIALAAVWTILYAFLPQMHERYLVWACAFSALLVARSWLGGLLVYLALTAIQTAMLLLSMIRANGLHQHADFAGLHHALQGLHPSIGWATLAIAIMLLAWSFARSRPAEPAPQRQGQPSPDRRAPAARRIAGQWQTDREPIPLAEPAVSVRSPC